MIKSRLSIYFICHINIIFSFSAGCGYRNRFEQLKEQVESTVPTAQVVGKEGRTGSEMKYNMSNYYFAFFLYMYKCSQIIFKPYITSFSNFTFFNVDLYISGILHQSRAKIA